MELKKLSNWQTIRIYTSNVQQDFPKAEIKPLSRIMGYLLRGRYPAYALYDGDDMVAYAILFAPEADGSVLIDHLAVVGHIRGKGYGSALLAELQKQFYAQGIIIEVENPKYAESEARRTEMLRRIEFYKRAGYRETPVESKLFGVEFSIMVLSEQPMDEADVRRQLGSIYAAMFRPAVREKNVLIKQ